MMKTDPAATEHRRVPEQREACLRQQAAVAAFGRRALLHREYGALADEAVALVASTLGVERSALLELLPEGDALLLRGGVGWRPGLVGHLRLGVGAESQCGYTLETGEPVIVGDVRTETRFKIPEIVLEHGVRSTVSVPVLGDGKPVGCLCALAQEPRGFGEDDVHFLQGIANGLAAALERQRADAALRQGEERFRIALKHAPIVLFNQDMALRYTWVYNPEAGFPAGSVLGKTDTDLLPADEAAHLTAIKSRVLKTGEGAREEVRTTSRGETLYYDLTVEPLCDGKGNVAGITCVASDVTARKRSEEEMAASLRDREALLREVHHRVKNNLQVICSLLDLQCGYIKDAEAVQMFKDSQNRIRSIALVHEQLHRSQGLAQIDCAEHVRTLTTHLFRSYAASPDAVRLKMEMGRAPVPADTAILCGLIVGELVANALRHAFPGGRKGELFIGGRENDLGQITLEVKDNGVGFPPDLNFRDAGSLGLQLVNLLTEQLKGTIELERNGGTRFKLVFPLREPA